MTIIKKIFPDEPALAQWAGELIKARSAPCLIYLSGPLGAGKTTLVRAMLRALGHQGPVKSPTFTLIEPYEIAGQVFYHLDLYRLQSSQELENIGFWDLFVEPAFVIIEWPERAMDELPPPDLHLTFTVVDSARHVCMEEHLR